MFVHRPALAVLLQQPPQVVEVLGEAAVVEILGGGRIIRSRPAKAASSGLGKGWHCCHCSLCFRSLFCPSFVQYDSQEARGSENNDGTYGIGYIRDGASRICRRRACTPGSFLFWGAFVARAGGCGGWDLGSRGEQEPFSGGTFSGVGSLVQDRSRCALREGVFRV